MGRRTTTPDLVAILEAAYRVESRSWLEGVLESARPAFDRGAGVCAFLYDASRPGRLALGDVVELGTRVPITATGMGHRVLSGVDSTFVSATYRSKICATASEEDPAFVAAPRNFLRGYGVEDVHVVNAMDGTGKGVVFASYLPKVTRLAARDRAAWTRVAAHVAAAYRLRRRTRRRTAALEETSDTILSRTGKLEHAGPHAESARAELRSAVIAYERAKGRLRSDPHASLEAWQVLVDRRWSLVDGFDVDGSSYVIARRNDAPARGPRSLTHRERQVLAYAALGNENKLIAYSLGIAHATVRVLLARAAKKLSVRSREDLIAAFLHASERTDQG